MKQIVPKEVVDSAPYTWNAQADEFNQWGTLGLDEQLEWAANRAAEWALEQAAKECAKIAVCYANLARNTIIAEFKRFYLCKNAAATDCETAVIALMNPPKAHTGEEAK